MNLKTTFLLIVLLGVGAGVWLWTIRPRTEEAASPTLSFLERMDPGKITRIEVSHGKEPRFVLERIGNEWSLPGRWPTRKEETEQWITTLTSLRSRFSPTPVTEKADMKVYGLAEHPLIIKVTLGDVSHTLRFGEEPGDNNRFTRPTYLRVDDKAEVVRLGPGIVSALDRPVEAFQQRRLFEMERVVKEEDGKDKVEQLVASQIDVQTPEEKFGLVKKDKEWELRDAFEKKDKGWQRLFSEDRVDPAKLKSILTGFADLWAEKFVDKKDRTLAAFGLDEPEYSLTVTRPAGAKLTMKIGKVSDKKTRFLSKPPPPNPFGPPPKPPEIVTEEYRFAKLEGNDQIFEVKVDKLKDIAAPLEALRDPQLARFRAADVKRLEVRHGEQDLVLVKAEDKWRFEKPTREEAETKPVEELLDKLSALTARDKEVLDNVDLKTVGLEKPQGKIKIALEEGKDKKSREIVFDVGTKQKEKEKSYVRVEPWSRVNQVNEDVWKLLQRPALAYRNRRILDIAAADISKIGVQKPEESFAFEKKDVDWKLVKPVQADVDSSKVDGLARELGKLEGVEFISESPKKEDLEKTYGLAKPKVSVKLEYKDAKKTAQTLAVGSKREGKQDYYARLDQGPVFAIKKELRDDLDRSSLAYRPLKLWEVDRDKIGELDIKKEGTQYRLKKDGAQWKVSGPVETEAIGVDVEDMVNVLAQLKAERYEAHQSKDPARYGLDKPTIVVRVVSGGKDKLHTVEIGKAVDNDAKSRFARVLGEEAIVVLSEKAITPLNRGPFDLIDKTVASVNPRAIQQVRVERGGKSSFVLEPSKDKGKDKWQVVGLFAADEDAVHSLIESWAALRADKFVAYGPGKIDWAQYGLDKPTASIRVTLKGDDDKTKKPIEHVLELGNEAPGGGRFVRLDKKDFVAIVGAKTVESLDRTELDFVDPRVMQYDADSLVGVQRQMKDGDLELARQEDQWRIAKPMMRDADNLTIGDLVEKTFRLRARRVAAYPAKDLQPFGLEKPVAVVTLELEGGKKKHVIKVGQRATDANKKETDERFAMIDDKPMVVVLPADLSRHLVAPVLYYADRNLASFSGVDHADFQQGTRKLAFAHPDSAWQLVEPVRADAEDAALEDLVRSMQRLRADEIVAEKGADLKKFGLEQPYLQWRFKSGDNEKLHLMVGGLDGDKSAARRYARLGGKDQIFLLSSKLTAKVAEEYRSRKPWTGLDVAQADELHVIGSDKSFTFKKKDSDWNLAGEPAVKVDAKKVTDTLDALAGLKALHYVADAKADLQLYGLDKPAWKISVQTPTGNRELLLGRMEGASQRFYATVAGSSPVFVIEEAEGKRLARPLSAFLESEKKK